MRGADPVQRRPALWLPGRPHVVRALRAVARWVEPLDPSLRALRRAARRRPLPDLDLVCVYRAVNADRVRRLLASLPPTARVALWALDDIHPALAARTVGHGHGGRSELVNRLLEAQGDRGAVLAVVDDDVSLARGTLVDLLAAGPLLGLQLWQPAHDTRSSVSWRFTRRRSLSLGRRTGFVEVGPVVLFDPAARRRLLPFPEDSGMGWGVEFEWAVHEDRFRLGIVDAVTLVHHGPVGAGYDADAETARAARALGRTGATVRELQVTHRCWRPWTRLP